tara:strand:- start:2646 stop:3035 length:390 start_codon:yes stop_codon:yes gene_type:complete
MSEVYKAIHDRLSAQLPESVYDHVPQNLPDSSYPFVRLDPLQLVGNDVDDKAGFVATIQVVSYSRYRGNKEISALALSVYNSLHRYNLPDTDTYGISGIQQTFERIATQPDGLTRNAVQQYEVLFEPLT